MWVYKMTKWNLPNGENDQYENLSKISQDIYRTVDEAIKDFNHEKDLYDPKLFGERRTYPQDWPAYNAAQMHEKILLISILNELLDSIPFPEGASRVGRKSLPVKERIFYLVLQAYNFKSSRRCVADVELCRRLGFVSKTPHFNSVLKSLRDSDLEVYLKHLINVSGLPLQQVETQFAVDSSGFSTSQFDRWFNIRTGKDSDKRRFKKAHITCGVKSNVITAVNITKGTNADSPQFEGLVRETGELYNVKEVSADKAYLSRKNVQVVSELGGIAFIPFKSNTSGKPKGDWIWRRMYDFYYNNQEEFMKKYHLRSNVETCFSMLKKKFGSHLRSKNETSQANEILAKCLAHNLCVLIQESFEQGIDIDFNKCANIEIAHK